MAFNKENLYQEGNSQEYFFDRTNLTANSANAEILKIKKSGCCGCEGDFEFGFKYEEGKVTDFVYVQAGGGVRPQPLNVANVGAQPVPAQPTILGDCIPRYVKFTFTDGQGNFATGVITDFNAPPQLQVDVTALNPNTTWTVIAMLEYNTNASIDCPCITEYTVYYIPLLGEFVFNPYELKASKASYVLNGQIIDGFSLTPINIGTYNIGDNIDINLNVTALGSKIVNIYSASGDGTYVNNVIIPNYGNIVYPNQTVTITAEGDSSLIAGTYTGSISVIDDTLNGGINVNVQYTLV